MKIEPLKIHKQYEGLIIYECGPVHFVDVKAGNVLADHTHNDSETFWFISGSGEMQVGDETIKLKAPCQFYIPGKIYHKFVPKTDTQFMYKYGD